MSFRAPVLFVFALSALATAGVLPRHDDHSSQCNTGKSHCCDSTHEPSSNAVSHLLGLLGVPIDPLTGLVGLKCSPGGVVGVGGTSCSAQPVCCTNNTFNGLVALGCTPINVNI
ncbi:hypothetical protein GALMADRAFT_136066 [Galerina marginata CBS 339.88]|uniref:Hydrophobin n=1 Tax=Galerina marginata (strain CBS 339.88) TaxID=685588 RepID=A0A067TPX0_GALM3|nr:hypothetical protein GALMADRAFT_136066 [Galerina marginata CBS 339.88]